MTSSRFLASISALFTHSILPFSLIPQSKLALTFAASFIRIPMATGKKKSQQPKRPSYWASKIVVTLTTHMALLLVLLRQAATDIDFEHDWYHPYDWTLNFNACRWSGALKGKYEFSVYPQARLGLVVETDAGISDVRSKGVFHAISLLYDVCDSPCRS